MVSINSFQVLQRLRTAGFLVPKRFYPSKKQRWRNKAEEEELPEFQYVGDNAKGLSRLYGWGSTIHGALGEPMFVERKKIHPESAALESMDHPSRLRFGDMNKVKDVACGYGFTLLAVENKYGSCVYGTGLNTDSQIGYHHPSGYSGPLEVVLAPFQINLPLAEPKKTKIVGIAAGRAHSLVLTDREGVFSLGHNGYGQCGRPIVEGEDYFNSGYVHKMAPESENITAVFCGQDSSYLLKKSGEILSCGWGADGQTGQGHYRNQSSLDLVKGDVEGRRISKLSCAADCVLAMDDQGEIFGWGNSEYSQLSMATKELQLNVSRALDVGRKVKDVASGGSGCLMLDTDGSVWSWGYGYLGNGSGTPELRDKPVKIPDPIFGKNEFRPNVTNVAVAAGLHHFAVVTSAGDLFMWGSNRGGCLGLGVRERDQYFPRRVSTPFPVKKVDLGVDHTIVICRDFL